MMNSGIYRQGTLQKKGESDVEIHSASEVEEQEASRPDLTNDRSHFDNGSESIHYRPN